MSMYIDNTLHTAASNEFNTFRVFQVIKQFYFSYLDSSPLQHVQKNGAILATAIRKNGENQYL